MVGERNLLEEVNYLSGVMFAHDALVQHIGLILIEAEALRPAQITQAVANMMEANVPEEIAEGFRETLKQFNEKVSGIPLP